MEGFAGLGRKSQNDWDRLPRVLLEAKRCELEGRQHCAEVQGIGTMAFGVGCKASVLSHGTIDVP